MFGRDLVFFHAPSLYDFRQYPQVFGPISDVIPSSPVFEMYPVGITSMADYLVKKGYQVQIINLAYRMLKDPSYDVEGVIRKTKSRYFALDLHWLPHAQGSLEIAALIRESHPKTPIIFGGLSASYYHEELTGYPQVDFVLRGDSTEEPLFQLLTALDRGSPLETIPNLTWKKEGEIQVNPLSHVPSDLDYICLPAYRYVIQSILKYRSIHNSIPYQEWLTYPTTLLLTARGCTYQCVICGGSACAFQKVVNRTSPAFRSPEQLMEDIRSITSFSRSPIFVVHDIRQGGAAYTHRFFQLLSQEEVPNEFIFELFDPAPADYLRLIDSSVQHYNLQLSLESHLERIRAYGGKFVCSNQEVEETLALALAHGCKKIDLFFMVGLPGQTYRDAVETVQYCKELLHRLGTDKIWPFIAPLAPFLDPGSLAFEEPEKYGYRKFCHTLEDHRQALLEPSWKYMLSYETEWMNRDEIVEATYTASQGMNELKRELGLLDEKTYQLIQGRIQESKAVLSAVDSIYSLDDKERSQEMERLKDRIEKMGPYSICGQQELRWSHPQGLKGFFSLGTMALRYVLHDINRVLGFPFHSGKGRERQG